MAGSLAVLKKYASLWLVNLVGWLVAGALAIGWLWIPDSSVPGVLWSIAQGAAALACLLILPGATLRFLAKAQAGEAMAWREAVTGMLSQSGRVLIWAAPAAGLCYLLGTRVPGWVFGPVALGLILPSLALAVLPDSSEGVLKRLGGALAAGAAAAVCAWALWSWHPSLAGVTGETVSVVVRGALAYITAVAGWLAAAALVAGPPAASRVESS